jgi:hypothetical protein
MLMIFEGEAAFQCGVARAAAMRLNQETAADPSGPVDEAIQRIWDDVETIMVACANLSKIFWGSRGRLEARRKPLRDSLGVADDSPLRDTLMRDALEHFDERLESWYDSSDPDHRIFVGRIVGPPGSVVIDSDDERVFRQFDPSTTLVTFWGHEISIQRLITETERIGQHAVAAQAARLEQASAPPPPPQRPTGDPD